MYKFCVFGGTTEGRKLAGFLSAQPCETTLCVATDYGGTLVPESGHLTVSAKKLPVDEIVAMLEREHFDLVIDATHPYAASITKSIARACEQTGTERWRLLRGASAVSDDAVFVESTMDAVRFLEQTDGNILLTTGSKELGLYKTLADFETRVWARVLPLASSLALCAEAGLQSSHIFAMQGPFSEDMNVAMLRSVQASWLVTKDGGAPGGFDEKLSAAKKAGARLVVVGRPPEEGGLSLPEVIRGLCDRFGLVCRPEVFVVGIGPGKESAQTAEVRAAIAQANCVIGAQRVLEAVARPQQTRLAAIAPEKIADYILSHPESAPFVVAMSGDTGFFSGTKKLLPCLKDCKVTVLPGLSSLSYLCARLQTSYEDVVPVSLHGRTHDITADVRRHSRIFTLVGGEDGMQKLCAALLDAGLGSVKLQVGERLGYPDERITCGTARELAERSFDKLSVALIENDSPDAVVTHGLPDEAFLRSLEQGHVVPMTKSEVRSVCLSKLRLTENAVCWDIGAGTGSVSIEMALQARTGSVWAIERNEDALALLARNQEIFRAENLQIVPGLAPKACEDLPAPSHVFIGGSAGNLREILQLVLHKNPQARIVATAVSLESAAELTECLGAFSFRETEVVCLQVSKGRQAGRYHLMTGQNPIYIFTMQHGGAPV